MRKTTFKTLSTCTKSLSSRAKEDFFGIANVTSKDISGAFPSETKLPADKIAEKYRPLMRSRNELENKEHDFDVTFGRLRFDEDNQPKVHGQFEPTNERKLYDTTAIKQAFVPDDRSQVEEGADASNETHIKVDDPNYREPYRIADVSPALSFQEVIELFREADKLENVAKYANTPPLTFYFESTISREEGSSGEGQEFKKKPNQPIEGMKLSGRKLNPEEIEESIADANLMKDTKPPLVYDPSQEKIPIELINTESDEYKEENERILEDFDKFDESIDKQYDVKKQKKTDIKGFEYLKQVRAQRIEPTAKGLKHRLEQMDHPYSTKSVIKLDSKGFRVYTHQVPDWKRCRRVEILSHIKNSIIYHNYDILAINKPYGIASHDENREREHVDMNSLVQEVANQMKIEKVYLAHRLDKTTTGVLLFATSPTRAAQLNKLFKSDQIKKTYLAITKGVPSPPEAIIDIPIGTYDVAGKTRSVLVPESFDKQRQLSKRYKEARRAITEYRVINQQQQAALVEVKPRTGVKHQIRVHLGFALNTPILGDHKYSHIGKLAPQTLPAQLLKLLHLRQEKVRTLPIHLHAQSVVIPGAKASGETLFINAPLPQHFVQNLKTIKLSYDK